MSLGEARRIGLAAQGFTDRRPSGRVDRRHLRRVLGRLELLQIDSVNVLARAHELPPFSRLGPYPTDLLARLTYRDRELFEYWGHEASLLPVALQPLLRWRMARAEQGEAYGRLVRLAREQPDWITSVENEVAVRGPLRAGDLDRRGGRSGSWWGWDEAKQALEWLFWTGRVAVADRVRFERIYDLTERVLPADVLAVPTPTEEEAHRALLQTAARALGVGTARDLADYFRIRTTDARARLAELVEDGALMPARVEGWGQPAFLHPDARLPRWVRAAALLAPFDPLVWERSRVDRLFGFHLRLELYVPAPQRRYGYYVLPFLLGERLVARADLKADRAAGVLRVRGAYLEAHANAGEVAPALAHELRMLGAWVGLDRVNVEPQGDLAPALGLAVGAQA
ncbi:MAG: winged helix-turn-helix domain-containing protein [Nitriliruptorales bacterium]|nr:winged helix-turn-helix domain-containing protein [Nitriliruptorales bacterium]